MMAEHTAILVTCAATLAATATAAAVERWGRYELTLRQAKQYDNPFTDVSLTCEFRRGETKITAEGFHDGGATWKVRCMPTVEGKWTYRTTSPDPGLDGKTGSFTVGPPSKGNHGPVVVRDKVHFAYADGTPYFQIGTTCYAWAHQGDKLEEQTLKTLRSAPFNKMRMCVFPKSYSYNKNEPQFYPFEGTPPRKWDFTRPNPAFWRHFEKRVDDLSRLGIEADLIVFHPYDRWGFKSMPRRADDRYLRYLVARLSSFRNVWWSLANEFDLMLKIPSKRMSDWDRFFQIIRRRDPYGHLRGIHNCRTWYDHNKPWVTHASVQSSHFGNAADLPARYGKPVVYDECKYEGNIPQGWGNISAREMVHRFWMGTASGCYVGHGETYKHPKDILWWSKGGVLHGQSPARIAFLKRVISPEAFQKMTPDRKLSPGNYAIARPGREYLVYFLDGGPTTIALPPGKPFKADGIDTWEMTVRPLGTARGPMFAFTPPKLPYALKLTAYAPGEALRPQAKITATPTEGVAPLKVSFAGAGGTCFRWSFGDGEEADGAKQTHTYDKPGVYTATLTVSGPAGASAAASVVVAVDSKAGSGEPIVRVGTSGGDSPAVRLTGKIARGADGSFVLGDGEPWKWVTVGGKPLEALEGLRSFTILGWAKPSSLRIGMGGNRIAFNLRYNRSGLDLVHLADGRLRLSVNEWPDHARNDSSPGKLRVGQWVFFAVTYDATRPRDNVRWYFGDENTPAALDRATTYNRGPTGTDSGPLTIGNYNPTIHRHGKDRQFRGSLRDIRILGSRVSSRGALGPAAIRRLQQGGGTGRKK